MIAMLVAMACEAEDPRPERTRKPEPVEIVDTGLEDCDSSERCCPMEDPDTGLACVPEYCCHTSRGCYWTGAEGASWQCGEPGERPCYEAQDLAVESCAL